MANCLVTKLKSVVQNDYLPTMDEVAIRVDAVSPLTDSKQNMMYFSANGEIQVLAKGAGYFGLTASSIETDHLTSKTIATSNYNVPLYFKNDTYPVFIDHKEDLFGLYRDESAEYKSLFTININDLVVCTKLRYLDLHNSNAFGDIKKISQHTGLYKLSLYQSKVTGDISALNGMTQLRNLSMSDINITGNIANIHAEHLEGYVSLANTEVYGDISTFATGSSISNINLENSNVSGDIASLANNTNLRGIYLTNTNVTGSINSLVNLNKLKYLMVPAGVGGAIETLAEGLIQAGIADGWLQLLPNGTITYNGGIWNKTFINFANGTYTVS